MSRKKSQPILSDNPATDQALLDLARLLLEIARGSSETVDADREASDEGQKEQSDG